MTDNRVYRKVGRRYVPIGMAYANNLSDGIWYVRSKGHSLTLLASLKELDDMPEQLTIVARTYALKSVEEAVKHFKHSWNLVELAQFVADYFAKGGKK